VLSRAPDDPCEFVTPATDPCREVREGVGKIVLNRRDRRARRFGELDSSFALIAKG
jgi:hypothetical protein